MGRRSSVVKWYHLKLLILIWVCFIPQKDAVFGPDSDKSALLEFKASVLDSSGVLASWDLIANPDHCSEWRGVSCGPGSRVVALNISGGGGNSGSLSCSRISQFPLYGFGIRRACLDSNVQISGDLPSSVSKLSELRVLSLPFNNFTGEIHRDVFGLEKLEVLDLEGNFLSGSLPSEIGSLRSLRVLNLGFNSIVGDIPDSLSNCSGLQVLNLAGNELNGTIPRFVGGFKDLRGLYLSFNQLSGTIPEDIGLCSKLERLELAGNVLTGPIPRRLGNCNGLKSLVLYSNMLEEVIPAELGRLWQLEVLDLSRNSLSGRIPSELGKCSKLSVLVLSNLWDPLPSVSSSDGDGYFGNPGITRQEFNFYEGTIPAEISALPSLRMIWVPRATLDGNFPGNWTCSSLEVVNLAQNYHTGGIKDAFSSCKNLRFLDLSGNRLTGELVERLPVPCLSVFDVSGNSLSGSIPRFQYNGCGSVPAAGSDAANSASSYLSYFAERSQSQLPYDANDGSGGFFVFHNFGGNNFTGGLEDLPIAAERMQSSVYAFFAGDNKLSGQFPWSWFENCKQLSGLAVNVSDNRLSGQFPADFGTACRTLKLFDASGNQITGIIPSSIGKLDFLVGLNLSLNSLQGPIPDSLGQLQNLKFLSLAGNNLTGPIPASLGRLQYLKGLELSSNSLTGVIPKDLASLRNLSVLLLNNNRLSGQIPSDLAHVSSLSQFNVSFNNLSGPLPQKENLMQCSSVLGNPLLHPCHKMFSLTSPSSTDQQGGNGYSQNYASAPSGTQDQSNGNSGFNSIEIASVASAAAIVAVLIALIILFLYTRKYNPRSRVGGTTRKEVTVFTDIGAPLTFENVVRATANFNATNCIGNGGFGATYKAEIAPGVLVAIKKLSVGRFQGIQQFDAEIKTLGRLHHPNLVTLIGYHASEAEMFLIYNYLSGGNLEKFIQERSTRAVDWRVLHKIALDIARALAYLHDQCVPRVLHRDVKPSNILLDEEHNAYLSDFGLARLLGTSETHATTGVAGTFGYVAPEYAMTCRVSDKADVYSYGVVLLELISDKKALDPSFSPYGNGFNIVAWACMLLRQGRAKEFFAAGLWDSGPHDDLVEVLHLAIMCTVDSLSTRPTMKMVVRRLKQLQPPPW